MRRLAPRASSHLAGGGRPAGQLGCASRCSQHTSRFEPHARHSVTKPAPNLSLCTVFVVDVLPPRLPKPCSMRTKFDAIVLGVANSFSQFTHIDHNVGNTHSVTGRDRKAAIV